MSYLKWFMVWFEPGPDDHIAYMTQRRIAVCGGTSQELFDQAGPYMASEFVNQGVQALIRWCRINCTCVPSPVNVRGKTGFSFSNSADALLFKLTWG